MYYPDEVIEEVRERNDIVDVISSYVNLRKKGANYFGLCPFHNEKTPSFSVSPSKQMYYCFGCGAGGNVISFVMQYENLSFPEAVRYLANRVGMTLPDREYSDEERREHDLKGTLLEINKEAATHFYHLLYTPEGKTALAYLKKRGLDDAAIRHFGLGYSSRRPGELYHFLKERGYSDSVLKESGLVTIEERGARDKFWNRAMFPILDANSRVIGFGGRVLGDGEPKYLNSPETKLFDKSRNLFGLNFAKSARKDFFLLCEGYMDVITLQLAGFTNAVASLGTALTAEHCLILKRYVKKVVLTYDSDGAGIKAAKRAIPLLKEAGISSRVLTMKPKKDPDEFIRAFGADGYQKRIDEAKNSFLWEIDQAAEQYDLTDPEGKTSFYRDAAERLTEFSEPLERDNYIQAVAREHMIPEKELRDLVNEIGAKKMAEQGYDRDRYAVPRTRADSWNVSTAKGGYRGRNSAMHFGMIRRGTDSGTSAGNGASGNDRKGGGLTGSPISSDTRTGKAENSTSDISSTGMYSGSRDATPNSAWKSESLLLSFLSDDPTLLPGIRKWVRPEDFSDPLCREIAEILYQGIPNGGITAGAILSRFAEDPEKQRRAASIFEAGPRALASEPEAGGESSREDSASGDPDAVRRERDKAAADCIRRMRMDRLNEESRTAVTVDDLQRILREKAALKDMEITLRG